MQTTTDRRTAVRDWIATDHRAPRIRHARITRRGWLACLVAALT